MSTESKTFDELQEMDESEVEAYRERQKERLDSAIEDEQRELNKEEQNALDILSQDAQAREELEEVEVGDATLMVTTSISGRLEERFNRLSDNPEDIDNQKEVIIDAILELVEDTQDGEEAFMEREVWQAIHAEYGTQYLAEVFTDLADPAMSRMEATKKFRT